jgi:predicted ester cyclase
MSIEHTKAVERQIVEEALNKGKLSVMDGLLAPDFVYHGPNGVEVNGPEGYKQFIAGLRTYYPDIHVTIENILAEGDLVATRTISTFTAKEEGRDTTPTSRKVTMMGSILDRFEGDKLAETWEVYDRLDLFKQLGLIPSKGPAKP